jgi:hypothetical protein
MDDISLLPQMLREQSLSDREIVLPYQEAKEALELLERVHWALLGWEGWVKYPDGTHGFAPGGVMGTESIEREPGEMWEDYVQRSVRFCHETIDQEYRNWNANPRYAHLVLSFCLTADSPPKKG